MKGDGGHNALRISMRDTEIVTCKYKNCLHDTKELCKSEAVKKGNSYYHADCLQTQEEIKEIIDLFKKHINPNPVYAQLQSVIKNIVFTKKLGSSFLLYGLKYYIEHKIPLNYPQGLYYVIQNKDVINGYAKEKTKNIKQSVEITEETESNFTYIPTKTNSFADILN